LLKGEFKKNVNIILFLFFFVIDIPVVRVLSNTYSVNIANSITLECTVTANPTHTSVTWLRVLNGVTSSINLGGNVQKYTGSAVNTPSLTIYNAVQADEGYYICQATNAVGTGQSSQTYLDVVGSKYKTLCWVVMVVIVW